MGGSRICPRAKYPVPNFCNFFFEHGPLTCLVPVPYIVAFVGYNPAAGTYEVPEFVPVRITPCQTSAIFFLGSRICPSAKYPVPNFCNFFMRFPNLSPCEIPRAKLLQFFFEHGPLTCLVPVPYIVAFVGCNPAAGTYEVPEFVPVRNTPCQTSAIFFFSMAHSHAWCQCHT